MMSTYLIAFIVSDYDIYENYDGVITKKRTKHRILANKNFKNSYELPLRVGEELLDDLVGYVGVNYDLPKMDQIGIADFEAGAMENWGLVTYQ